MFAKKDNIDKIGRFRPPCSRHSISTAQCTLSRLRNGEDRINFLFNFLRPCGPYPTSLGHLGAPMQSGHRVILRNPSTQVSGGPSCGAGPKGLRTPWRIPSVRHGQYKDVRQDRLYDQGAGPPSSASSPVTRPPIPDSSRRLEDEKAAGPPVCSRTWLDSTLLRRTVPRVLVTATSTRDRRGGYAIIPTASPTKNVSDSKLSRGRKAALAAAG